MSEKTLIPIFAFWAFLTIITPTLILLSENSKADLDSNGNLTEGMKVRRIIGFRENDIIRTAATQANKSAVEVSVALAPAPFPTGSHSSLDHNYNTLISNNTVEEQVQHNHTSIS